MNTTVRSIACSIDVQPSVQQEVSIQQQSSMLGSMPTQIARNEVLESSENLTGIESSKTPQKVKFEPTKEPEPLFSTCSQHLREIRNLQDGSNASPNESSISPNFVRRMSANIARNTVGNTSRNVVASSSALASTSSSANPLRQNPSQNLGQNPSQNRRYNSDDSSDSEDDCVITRISGTVLRPFRSTTDDLIKQENDRVSGNIPFINTVSPICRLSFLYVVLY